MHKKGQIISQTSQNLLTFLAFSVRHGEVLWKIPRGAAAILACLGSKGAPSGNNYSGASGKRWGVN